MPGMRGWNLGKEIIRVPDENRRSVLGHLLMEENLGSLGHAGYGLDTEMTECGNHPGIEIRRNEITASFGRDECIEHKLSTAIISLNETQKMFPYSVLTASTPHDERKR